MHTAGPVVRDMTLWHCMTGCAFSGVFFLVWDTPLVERHVSFGFGYFVLLRMDRGLDWILN